MTNVNCHYGPPGNKGIMPVGIGRKPFRKGGQSCEDCESGHGWVRLNHLSFLKF